VGHRFFFCTPTRFRTRSAFAGNRLKSSAIRDEQVTTVMDSFGQVPPPGRRIKSAASWLWAETPARQARFLLPQSEGVGWGRGGGGGGGWWGGGRPHHHHTSHWLHVASSGAATTADGGASHHPSICDNGHRHLGAFINSICSATGSLSRVARHLVPGWYQEQGLSRPRSGERQECLRSIPSCPRIWPRAKKTRVSLLYSRAAGVNAPNHRAKAEPSMKSSSPQPHPPRRNGLLQKLFVERQPTDNPTQTTATS